MILNSYKFQPDILYSLYVFDLALSEPSLNISQMCMF